MTEFIFECLKHGKAAMSCGICKKEEIQDILDDATEWELENITVTAERDKFAKELEKAEQHLRSLLFVLTHCDARQLAQVVGPDWATIIKELDEALNGEDKP